MTCQNAPIAYDNFQEFDFCWQLMEGKKSLFFFNVYLVIFTLIFGVCMENKLSEAYLLAWVEGTDYRLV